MSEQADPIDSFFRRAAARLGAHPEWARELQASEREFFPGGRPAGADDGARRRHLEWFLLERVDARGPELALERAAQTVLADDPALGAPWFESLRESHVGVFEVTGAEPGEGLWLRDLGGRGEFPVADATASRILAQGDVIAGRIFALPGGAHRLSPAAACHRDARLAAALRADFEAAREQRRGVLRVGQREIEDMFFGGAAPLDAPAEARRLLIESGVDAQRVDAWLEDLAAAPFDEERLVHGAQDVLSEILDELAFESAVDLESTRRALLAAWAELARRGPGTGPSLTPAPRPGGESAPEADVARAVARFEERRRAGEPLGAILADLERDLALGDEAEEGEPIPDFPGVVGAMVEEFLWETGAREGPIAAARHANLRDLGRSAEHVGVFENLRGRDLLVYAGWWLLETGTVAGADDARARVASLAAFCRWAESEHEVALHTEFHATLVRLGTSLPRVAEANQRRTRAARRDEGELYEIVDLAGEEARLRARSGVESAARIGADLVPWLAAGDRLRGRLGADGRLAVYCCYPPEVVALTE
ncbi:MAG: hypothetical protein JNK02_15515 [Planctomycetes bacterium]|nr:hypothetical protein [Planctomycetota bacterium]